MTDLLLRVACVAPTVAINIGFLVVAVRMLRRSAREHAAWRRAMDSSRQR